MTAIADPASPSAVRRVARVEIHPRPGQPDAVAHPYIDALRRRFGPAAEMRAAVVYLIESTLNDDAVTRAAEELLADPVTQRCVVGVGSLPAEAVTSPCSLLEVHYLPGVMDPVAQSAREAIVEMTTGEPGLSLDDIEIRTGIRFDLIGVAAPAEEIERFARQTLANTVIQEIHCEPFWPQAFPHGHEYRLKVTQVPIRELDDAALVKMSREAHLFLSLDEMRAVRDHYRAQNRDPNDVELETLAQTWSEHCVHKTLKATVRYREQGTGDRGQGTGAASGTSLSSLINFASRPGHVVNPDGSITIHNLLKSTIAAATKKLTTSDERTGEKPIVDWCVSVFVDNAGVIKFDEHDAVCIKVETHNRPSAIEPYGGAATGIGGCIRDVMGTGLSAKPIANMDVFCVAFPGNWEQGQGPGAKGQGAAEQGQGAEEIPQSDPSALGPWPLALPKGIIHPRRILQRVVAGVRDYGNRMGIPTVNGAVAFHDDYLGNPLVFCGCVGLLPLDKCFGEAAPGDRIVALGGRTGRDGIHGATFSSAELTDTHADEFSHAVQIGNAITQKKMLDVILQARDFEGGSLYRAITDCGAGGFSSAVGEMGEDVGAHVTLETAPLKYRGLSYTEIWISEAQERMILAVPPQNMAKLRELCDAEDVEMCDLGYFGCRENGTACGGEGEAMLVLSYAGTEVGRMSMHFLHNGIPMPTREAEWGLGKRDEETKRRRDEVTENRRHEARDSSVSDASSLRLSLSSSLFSLLSHPNIASKHWIIRQYDHEVQGGSVIKPLVGPKQDGPGDAAVVRPKLDGNRGLAIGCGLAQNIAEKATERGAALDGDSYFAALAAIDEAVRNVVCAGADPTRIAILDNFCWAKCDDPRQFGALVRAAEACYDGALAYKTPFVSGKDSLSNQFTQENGQVITIPQTLLITAMGIVPDVTKSRTMDAKAAGNVLLIVGDTTSAMGGSHAAMVGMEGQGPRAKGQGEETKGQGPRAEGQGEDGVELESQIRNPKSEIRNPPLSIRNLHIPRVDLSAGPRNAAAVAALIEQRLVASAHDCSDGGLLVAAAEMAFAGRVGLDMDITHVPTPSGADAIGEFEACFAETPSRYLLEVAPAKVDAVVRALKERDVPFAQVGVFARHDRLTVRTGKLGRLLDESLDRLRETWLKPLDW